MKTVKVDTTIIYIVEIPLHCFFKQHLATSGSKLLVYIIVWCRDYLLTDGKETITWLQSNDCTITLFFVINNYWNNLTEQVTEAYDIDTND